MIYLSPISISRRPRTLNPVLLAINDSSEDLFNASTVFLFQRLCISTEEGPELLNLRRPPIFTPALPTQHAGWRIRYHGVAGTIEEVRMFQMLLKLGRNPEKEKRGVDASNTRMAGLGGSAEPSLVVLLPIEEKFVTDYS